MDKNRVNPAVEATILCNKSTDNLHNESCEDFFVHTHKKPARMMT